MGYLATKDYFEDRDFVDKWLYTIRTGELDLSWMEAATEKVSPHAENPRRGLIYRDIDLGSYGYSDLPENPTISPMVRLWKGAAKPLALFAVVATAALGFLHYIGIGPNETDEADEEAARRESEKSP